MKITVAIYAAPLHTPANFTALQYCRALLEGGHTLHRLFFYGNGVHTATTLCTPPQDELNLPSEWQALIREYQLDAVVCIAAALRRGVLNKQEATRYEKSCHNLAAEYELSGLGQLIEAAVASDRVITFGE